MQVFVKMNFTLYEEFCICVLLRVETVLNHSWVVDKYLTYNMHVPYRIEQNLTAKYST